MKAVVIKNLDGKLETETIPIPVPKKGELLIKNEGSQINPADINYISRTYKEILLKEKFVIPGFEAVGIVTKVGDSTLNTYLNKKVTYMNLGGTWAEYTIIKAYNCLVIDGIDTKGRWPGFVNPLTVICLLDIVRTAKVKCIVQTGASSSLGQMFLKVCILNDIKVINTVKRKEHVETLRKIGATEILVQDDPEFKNNFRNAVSRLNPTIAFESVAGEFGGLIFNLMPPKSKMYLYGSLSLKPLGGISPVEMIYKHKDILHFQTTEYLMSIKERIPELLQETVKYLDDVFLAKISKNFDMKDIENALKYYQTNMSEGKVILRPKF